MAHRDSGPRSVTPLDFFISYSPADEAWATWIAWELELVGYRTMLQAWDFVPGTNFIDFMDRGVSEATAVIAVLSDNYLRSRYGRLEWQAALRADPDRPETRLITVRVQDCELYGLLAAITYLDLVDVADPTEARARLLDRIRHAVEGRAKPAHRPHYPRLDPPVRHGPALPAGHGTGLPRRARPAPFPALAPPASTDGWRAREAIFVLHLPALRIGDPASADCLTRVDATATQLAASSGATPDLLVVSGDLAAAAAPRQYDAALELLTALRVRFRLGTDRVVIVPGAGDVNESACRGYFALCEADEIKPQAPYWPKWRHFARFCRDFYGDPETPAFTEHQPWTLCVLPDLHIVVCGLNSTMPHTHRKADRRAALGNAQERWFAQEMAPYRAAGWLRLAVADDVPPNSELLPSLHAVMHGRAGGPDGLPMLAPPFDGSPQLLAFRRDGVVRWRPSGDTVGSDTLSRRWSATGTFR